MLESIEDCLEHLVFNTTKNVLLEDDVTIVTSIARQVSRGMALTDRQYNLMQEKLSVYSKDFKELNFSAALHNTRQPLRDIDRSKTITIEDDNIKVRFPFSKKLISKINDIIRKVDQRSYSHERSSHEHFFMLTEKNTVLLLDKFIDSSFIIDKQLVEFYNKILEIKTSPLQHLPAYHNGMLYNISDELKDTIKKETNNDIRKIVDRHRRYGLVNLDKRDSTNNILDEIVYRPSSEIIITDDNHSLPNIINSIDALDRFPLLVIAGQGKEHEHVLKTFYALDGIIKPDEQNVFFRDEGSSKLNEFIIDKKLNRDIDKHTKVVYIKANKFPKVLLKIDWKPVAAIVFDSTAQQYKKLHHHYITNMCDLIIHRTDNRYQTAMYNKWWSV